MTKGARTRHAILRAAIERFARDGFRVASVADIARDAGVSGTLVYAYFPNKEALFLAAVDEDASGLIHLALPVAADVGHPDRPRRHRDLRDGHHRRQRSRAAPAEVAGTRSRQETEVRRNCAFRRKITPNFAPKG